MGNFPCYSVQHRYIGDLRGLAGHPLPVFASKVIHGKTGPAPSSVNKEKGREIGDVGGVVKLMRNRPRNAGIDCNSTRRNEPIA